MKQQLLVVALALVAGWALGQVTSSTPVHADAGGLDAQRAERLVRAVEQLARCRK